MPRRSARAPRLASLPTILFISTVLFSVPVPAFPQTNNLYVVCKEPDSLVCLAWPIDLEDLIVTKGLYESDGRECGLSNLIPIPPHRRFIVVRWFNATLASRLFCKTTKVKVLPVSFELNTKRVRRQSGYHPRGRYRGQTQSQYLSIDRGNGKDEGKAEAHSAADSSRAVVSGNSGMGQAQSQTIYDPSCEDCPDRNNIDVANLAYKPDQKPFSGTNGKSPGGSTGGTYGPGQSPGGTYAPGQSPGGTYAPGQSSGGTYAPGLSPGGTYGPGQSPGGTYAPGQLSGAPLGQSVGGSNGPNEISAGPGQPSSGTYGPSQTPGGSQGSGQSPGSSVGGGQFPGGAYGPSQQAGGSYGPGGLQGNTYVPGREPSSSYAPNQLPNSSYRPGQTPGDLDGQAGGSNTPSQTQPGGSSTFVKQPGGAYNSGQAPGGSYGQGQIPGGSYIPGQSTYGSRQPQPGSFIPGQTAGGYIPGQSPSGTNRQGQTYYPGQSPGAAYGSGPTPGGSYSPGQPPGLLGQLPPSGGTFVPGGSNLQGGLPGGSYVQGTLPGGTGGSGQGTYTPGSTGGPSNSGQTQGGFYPPSQTGGSYGSNAGQSPGSNGNQLNGPGSGAYGGTAIQPGAQGINWPLLSSILPGAAPGSTYFCCVVNPGNNAQNGVNPSNTYFGIPGGQNQFPTSNKNIGLGPYTGTLGENNVPNIPSQGSAGANQANFQNSGGPTANGYNGQPQLQNLNRPYGQTNIPYGNVASNNLQTPNVQYGSGQSGVPSLNGPYSTGQNVPNGSPSVPGNLQSQNGPYGTSGQNVPIDTTNIGQNGLGSPGPYGTVNMGSNPSIIPSRTGQTNIQHPDGAIVNGGTGQNVPYAPGTSGLNGTPSIDRNYISGGIGRPNVPYGTGNGGQNGIVSSGPHDTSMTGQNPVYGPRDQGQNTITFPNGQYGAGNTLQTPNGMGGGLQNTGVLGNGAQNLSPTNLQNPSNTYGPGYNGQPLGLNGQYNPVSGQNIPTLGGTYGNGNGGQFGTDQNNLMIPNNYGGGHPGAPNQQGGINNGVDQQNVGLINANGGVPQNVLDPNSITVSFDDYDSEAQASVSENVNGTTALAASKGGNKKGRAQTQVEGTYTGSGSFSANAEISDENKAAQSHVSGSKKGANSNAEGRGRKNKSQASVQLGSETGSILTDSQSSGDMHSSSSQVQGSVKGGMADAQAKGPGSTSSQAQIGFTPYKEEDKAAHDKLKIPFEGGGTASAQTSGRMGTSQSQLRGTFKYGITYNGAAQSGSSLDKDAVFSNLVPFEKIDVYDENNKNINIEASTTEKLKEATEIFTQKYEETTTSETQTDEAKHMSDHSHSDHHKFSDQQNSTTRPPPEGNRRSFTPSYNANGGDYEYSTDKDDNQQEDYDIDDGFGADTVETSPDQNEYANYDELNRDTVNTHQSLQSASKKGLEVKQTNGGNMQHIILGSLNNHDARVVQKNSEHPDESKVYQPGEKVPGMGGYTIPVGFTGSVKSVASKDKTYVVGSKYSPSQAQTVTLTPGTGKVKYLYPNRYGHNVNPKDLRSLYDSKADDNRYVSVSKSVTRDLDNEDNVRRQYSHTYYTKSSSCGYFTFTCTMVSSAEGKKKVCKPKIPRNPDGSPMKC
ncbi:hypothetical protein evm_013024 [Chilo suppressalis]|nr:hypothetical protein evm_013024 [Chilo suppressalis]